MMIRSCEDWITLRVQAIESKPLPLFNWNFKLQSVETYISIFLPTEKEVWTTDRYPVSLWSWANIIFTPTMAI